MWISPSFDPVLLALGPVQIHWYGVMYLLGFVGAYAVGWWRFRQGALPLSLAALSDFIFFWMVLSVVIGGRLGYVLFYQPSWLWQDPLAIFRIWEGGMSFHGGLLGVLVGTLLYARAHQLNFWALTDMEALMIPIGLFFGRIGNFINGELWGRPTLQAWGVVFPWVDGQPRHPSQLYEAFLEGIVLGIILWGYARRPRPDGAISGLFLMGYGLFRGLVECFREPDRHVGFILNNWLTVGQLLSLPLIIAGLVIFVSHGGMSCKRT